MRKIAIALFVISCCCFNNSYAQDMIQLHDGTKLRCKIVKEDSVSLYFILPRQDQPKEVKKTQVRRYSIAISPSRSTPSATLSPRVSKTDLLVFNLSGGFANPLGEFASRNVLSSSAGLAKTGHFFQASLRLKLSKHIGLAIAYHYQFHSIDSDHLNNQLSATYQGTYFSTTSTDWKIRGFFGGIYVAIPIGTVEGLSVFASAIAGLPTYVSPEIKTTGIQVGLQNSVTQNASSTTAICYLGGVGLHYKIYSRVGISLSVNYLNGKASFSGVSVSNNSGYATFVDFKQKFESSNVQLGVSFAIE